ncbi:hypothetical protein [Ereboglobus luteus]|uniref:Uncharacterized protein n=1 Tax=Ereboglobus luteus TaxID=1796921 RepID=A0A2U8E668_9BACT|nr:hypothetical protein [Ereboglobus luteus]AWI10310.1 hypothetical protein CKA38_14550 [Ereboglobus luteus]
MLEFETVKVIAGIIAHEMALPVAQIALYEQGDPEPGQTVGLRIAIDILEKKVLNNNVRHETREGSSNFWEVQTMQVQELISINIFSTGQEAHERNHEIVLALGSTYAQQVQEKHGLHICRIPTAFTKAYAPELLTRANHYTITVNAQRAHKKEGNVDYYNQFQPVEIITQPTTHN